jgi:hypothetical protein
MSRIHPQSTCSTAAIVLLAGVGLATPLNAAAQEVAPSYKAASDVYQLVAENEHFRVIVATWKPGQRDAWHSHAGQVAAYSLTGCEIRLHTPDGKYVDRSNKKGGATFNPIIPSHSLENRSKTECQSVLVEKK